MIRDYLRVYFVMGSQNVQGDPLYVLEEALKGGITAFQFREKGEGSLVGNDYVEFARKCQHLCKQYMVPFIVNDDLELALRLKADGIHVGQDDAPVKEVRQIFADKLVGVSIHTLADVKDAVLNGADYVGIGPIFPTESKLDAKKPSGCKFLREVKYLYPNLPIVAIGGITLNNMKTVLEVGADGIAVISAISLSDDPLKTVENFILEAKKTKKFERDARIWE